MDQEAAVAVRLHRTHPGIHLQALNIPILSIQLLGMHLMEIHGAQVILLRDRQVMDGI